MFTMAPFSIPAPCIIPLRIPIFGGPKSIDTNTKIELLCETYLEHEIFYTLDGTRPQPYAGIVQGNKTIKYTSPFCLPAGKIVIKALAINTVVHTMCSSVVTKRFEVLKVKANDENKKSPKAKQRNGTKKSEIIENKNKINENADCSKMISDVMSEGSDSVFLKDNGKQLRCLEKAFIGNSDFDIESSKLDGCIDDESSIPVDEDVPNVNGNPEDSEDSLLSGIEGFSFKKGSNPGEMDSFLKHEKDVQNTVTLTDSGTSVDTQFCCVKCDLTLQQCNICNKMNAVSSKFCINCGRQLLHQCHFCDEWSSSNAAFCQFCGKKLGTRLEPYIKSGDIDHLNQGVLAQPQLESFGVQNVPVMVDKVSQTSSHCRSPVKRGTPEKRRMPNHSPGRGYWHQQLDYICNHLKSHAYNNVDFRKEISEPALCEFKSAHITKEENDIIVTVIFSPYVYNKSGFTASDEPKDKDQGCN